MGYPAKTDLAELIAAIEETVAEISIEEVPPLLGDLERLKTSCWARLTAAQIKGNNQTLEEEDQLLTAEQAAQKLGINKDWLYRHSKKLAFTVRLGKRHVRFSLRGIEKYISQRRGR